MAIWHDWGARALSLAPAESAHKMTIKLLAQGYGPRAAMPGDPCLKTEVAGISFPNPLGLAAGFDKNAEAPAACLAMGFGFVEIGAVTPRPQTGNPQPRVFRLPADRAVINRMGFNNEGLEVVRARLAAGSRPGVIGANLGANKDSEDRIADYVALIEGLAGRVDFFTINISSPNTPGLRDLQTADALDDLLSRALVARDGAARDGAVPDGTRAPVFLKVAPDLEDEGKADIVAVVKRHKVDGLIVSNTTTGSRDALQSPAAEEKGGLSGAPLFRLSTDLLREFHQEIDGALPLIGVGGVSTAREAYVKILAGASLVQLYSALVFEGPGLPERIVQELPRYLRADGFESVAEAVGAETR